MAFLYEANILKQPSEWKRILDISLPSKLSTLDSKRIYFVGIGSSFWAAKIAEFLWKEYVQTDAIAVQSYDFVNSRYFISPNDNTVHKRISQSRLVYLSYFGTLLTIEISLAFFFSAGQSLPHGRIVCFGRTAAHGSINSVILSSLGSLP